MAIDGFLKRYAQLVSERDYLLADYIADQAHEIYQMTDQEFIEKHPDTIYQGES